MFGPDARSGYVRYSAILRHIGMDREFMVDVGPSSGISMNATPEELAQREAENDMLFVAVVQELASLGTLEVISAKKAGNFTAELNL